MKYFLPLIIVFLSAQLIGQPYMNETSRWKQYYIYTIYPPGIAFEEDMLIQLDGDTMVGSTIYHRVLKSGIGITYYPQSNDTIFHGLLHEYLDPIREGEKAIYAYNRVTQEEYLLYDFNLEVGDTLKTGYCERDTVISIDTLYLGDMPRRQFHLPNMYGGGDISTLVEGIGSTFGFYWAVCNVPPVPHIKLQCFSQDGDFIQFDSTYDCSGLLLADEVIKADAVSIHPNPFTDEIEVQFPHEFQQVASISILSLTGIVVFEKQLLPANSIERIALPDIPTGIYIVSIRHQQGITSQKMMKL